MRRVLLLVLGLLAAPLLMVLTAGPAHACSCVGTPFAEQVADAGVVFTGTVTGYDDPVTGPVVSSAQPITWTFAADTVHRGDIGARATVVAALSEASCGVTFGVGQRYVVVGTLRRDGGIDTGLCTGTTRYAALRADDVAALGAGRAVPTPTPVPTPVAAAGRPPAAQPPIGPIVAGVAGLLAVAAIVTVAVRRG